MGGSNSEGDSLPTTIRLFGVEHDKHSVPRIKTELKDFISEDTSAIFFEAPNSKDLREGEGLPEPGYHITSFFWEPFFQNPSIVIHLLLVGLIPNLIKELYYEGKFTSFKPWEWKVGRRVVSEWEASKEVHEELGIPLIKVGPCLDA